MISIKCPHCHVGLKVDETKIPVGIDTFKCPKCKQPIPLSILKEVKKSVDNETDTALILPLKTGIGKLTVLQNEETPSQTFPLYEGIIIIGRKAKTSAADIPITTDDKSMSRSHIRIEVKKMGKNGYKHYLTDNNSKNHTLYNNNDIGAGETIVLKDNDEIIIGRTVIRFNE